MISLILSGFLWLLFSVLSPEIWDFNCPILLHISVTVLASRANSRGQREKKKWEFASPSWDHSSTDQKRRLYFLRVLAPAATAPDMRLLGGWSLREWKKGERARRDFCILSQWKELHAPWDRARKLLLEFSLSTLQCPLWVWVVLSSGLGILEIKTVSSLSVQWYFQIVAFIPNLLATIYFSESSNFCPIHSAQFCRCIQWERQGGMCLLHLNLNQNPW